MASLFARRVRPLNHPVPSAAARVRSRNLVAAGAVVAVAAVIAALVPNLATAAPVHDNPKPTVESVQKQLGQLAVTNSQLVEKYDQAQVAVTKREKAASVAQTAATRASTHFAAVQSQFVQLIQAQYEGQSFGATGALLASDSGSNYLDRLSTMDMISSHTAQVVDEVKMARNNAASAASTAQTMLAAATKQRDAVAAQKKSVQAQINKYQSLLETLSSAQQAAYQRAANPSVPTSTLHLTNAGSGAAKIAVQFALAQVGKPYVFGAAGPGSFDCSGLTMAAWAHAGVSLPHSAADQYNYGQHVARNDLEPGDLLFFYQPIGHVTIYIGDGYMVSAPTEGENVSVVPLAGYGADYVGATRLT